MDFTTPARFEWDEGGDAVQGLYSHLAQLKDKRKRRGVRYPLAAVLVMLVVAKLSGEDELRGIAQWVKLRGEAFVKALGLKHQTMPHPTTYSRILNEAVDSEALEQAVGAYLSARSTTTEAIALDGKALRGTIGDGQTHGQHLLAAYGTQSKVVLHQTEVGEKANEITAAPSVLAALPLAGRVVTGDAMFAQRSLSQQVLTAGGHYLWIVKDNQPTLRAAIERLFTAEVVSKTHSSLHTDFQHSSSFNSGHGRLEQRTLTTSSLLNAYLDWPGLGQVFKIERHVTHRKTKRVAHQTEYGITSLSAHQAAPLRLLALVRGHWHIENKLHYPRDVSFHEDACRIQSALAHHAIAILNNLVLGLLARQPFDFVPDARRFFAANLSAALAILT